MCIRQPSCHRGEVKPVTTSDLQHPRGARIGGGQTVQASDGSKMHGMRAGIGCRRIFDRVVAELIVHRLPPLAKFVKSVR